MPVPGAVLDPSLVHDEERTLHASDGHDVAVYIARPASAPPGPGLVIIHAAYGVTDHTRDVARRFAAQGIVAAAPDLFGRVDGGAPPPGAERDVLMDRIGRMGDAGAIDDLRTTAAFVRANDACNGRVACMGFCMGGRLALLIAAEEGAVDAAIDCWGGRIRPPSAPIDDLHPVAAIDRVPDIRVPVLGVFGDDDQNPSPDDVAALRRALAGAGVDHRIVSYPNAGHALFADNQPTYREGPAHQAWGEYVRFLERLAGPRP